MKALRVSSRSSLVLVLALGMVSGAAFAQESGGSPGDKLGVSLRLGLELETEPDATIDLQSFGSRFTWEDEVQTTGGLGVLAFIDLAYGLDQAVGTREIWLGVEEDFGTIKGGTQFRAFYDMTTSFTDVGWWDTCFVGIGCARAPGVLKYENTLSPTTRYALSATLGAGLSASDEEELDDFFGDLGGFESEDEFIDQLDGGAIVDLGDLEVGFAFGLDLVGDTGFGLGAAARTTLDTGMEVAALAQFVTEDYGNAAISGGEGRTLVIPRDDDGAFMVSVSAEKEQLYGLVTLANAAETGIGITGGYKIPLQGTSLAYAEVSGLDNGAEGSDFEFQARAVFVYHFGAEAAARRR